MEKQDFKILWLVAVAFTLLVAATIWWAGWTPEQVAAWSPLKCPIYFFSGLRCPTCGLGHALTAAVAGEWRQSLQYHPLALPALYGGIAAGILLFLAPNRFQRLLLRCRSYIQSHRRLAYGCLAGYTIWGIGRWYI